MDEEEGDGFKPIVVHKKRFRKCLMAEIIGTANTLTGPKVGTLFQLPRWLSFVVEKVLSPCG
jgi:hypothetical protein